MRHIVPLMRWCTVLLIVAAVGSGCETNGEDQVTLSDPKCQEIIDVVLVSGRVSVEAFTGGTITLTAFEEASLRCGSIVIPGRELGQVTLPGPGPFRLTLAITRVMTATAPPPPNIELIGFYDANANRQCEAGDAVAHRFLPPQDQADVEVRLVRDNCGALVRL